MDMSMSSAGYWEKEMGKLRDGNRCGGIEFGHGVMQKFSSIFGDEQTSFKIVKTCRSADI